MAAHFRTSPLLIGATVEAPPIRFLANELPSGTDACLGDGPAVAVCHTQHRYIKRPEAPRNRLRRSEGTIYGHRRALIMSGRRELSESRAVLVRRMRAAQEFFPDRQIKSVECVWSPLDRTPRSSLTRPHSSKSIGLVAKSITST